jgi:8-oxo-dGTP pyrophosphatase MutT (NUDIX family)
MTERKGNWEILGEKRIYDNPWIRLTEFDVLNPSGGKGIYGKVHFKNKAIGIVALDQDGSIHLVGQSRFTLSTFSWEIPEGGGPLQEPPLSAAQRELREETGLEADHWRQILEMHLSNSVTDEHGFVFLATGLRPGPAHLEETEDIRNLRLPFDEALAMVLDGRITDAMTVAAILRVKLMLDGGEIEMNKRTP